MEIQRIDTIFFRVADVERATGWYRDHLGLEPGDRHGNWQVLKIGGEVVFALHGWPEPPTDFNCVPSLRVPDLAAAIAELARAGIEPVDATPTDTGVKRFTTFADPDGNRFQLIEVTAPS